VFAGQTKVMIAHCWALTATYSRSYSALGSHAAPPSTEPLRQHQIVEQQRVEL
jgi:hypothetical protein